MTDGPDTVRPLVGFGAALSVAVVCLVVVTVGVQGVAFPAGGAPGVAPSLDASPASGAPITQPPADDARGWRTYRTIVVFRNDDVQPGWREDELRTVHRVFLETGVPVTDAVIPFDGNRSIARRSELCSSLAALSRERPTQFEYALHGYTHIRNTGFHGGSEFGGVPPDRQSRWIRRGKRALADCTGTAPRVFVPPFNTYDDATLRALNRTGFSTVSSATWFTREAYGARGAFTVGGVRALPSTHAFVANWSTDVFYGNRSLEASFDAAYRNRSLVVQMLHYTEFTSAARIGALRGLIEHMRSKPGVRFMTLGQLSRGLANGTVERTAEGWRVHEPVGRGGVFASNSSLASAERAAVSRDALSASESDRVRVATPRYSPPPVPASLSSLCTT